MRVRWAISARARAKEVVAPLHQSCETMSGSTAACTASSSRVRRCRVRLTNWTTPGGARKSERAMCWTKRQFLRPKFRNQRTSRARRDLNRLKFFFTLRDKDEKRRHRTERDGPVKEFEHVSQYLEARSDKKKNTKRKSEAVESKISTPPQTDQVPKDETERVETKEQRRERRQRRREDREQKREALAALQNQHQRDSKLDTDVEDATAKAARKVERRRRKAEMIGTTFQKLM